jgi:hypothetical protein
MTLLALVLAVWFGLSVLTAVALGPILRACDAPPPLDAGRHISPHCGRDLVSA